MDYEVRYDLVIESTIEAFDESAFKASLLRVLGDGSLTTDDITLNITAASLHIAVLYTTRNATLADQVTDQLTVIAQSTPQELSASLGVVVVSNGEVSQRVMAAPSAVKLAIHSGNNMTLSVSIAAGGGVLLLAVVLACVWRCYRTKAATKQLLNTYPVAGTGFSAASPGNSKQQIVSPRTELVPQYASQI